MKLGIGKILGVIIFIAFIVWIFWPSTENEQESINSFSFEPALLDQYDEVEEIHWGHMPLTYRFENECVGRQLNLTRLAFKKVELETLGVISFIETPEEPDISIYCKPFKYERYGGYDIADAFYTLSPNSENLIEKGEINIYGQGQVCNTGYPALEVHEILHLFNMPHNPLTKSIMHSYSAESSSRCKTTKIDEEYVSCLRYIYSNGKFNGNCSFSSYILEDSSDFVYECEEGWFEVEGTDFCCPEPNMVIVDGYCESLS